VRPVGGFGRAEDSPQQGCRGGVRRRRGGEISWGMQLPPLANSMLVQEGMGALYPVLSCGGCYTGWRSSGRRLTADPRQADSSSLWDYREIDSPSSAERLSRSCRRARGIFENATRTRGERGHRDCRRQAGVTAPSPFRRACASDVRPAFALGLRCVAAVATQIPFRRPTRGCWVERDVTTG